MDYKKAMNRRFFLGGTLAVVGAMATAFPVTARLLWSQKPILWGDGVHDDAPGLNALFAHEPVDILHDFVRISDGVAVYLNGGVYRLASTVNISKPHNEIRNCQFIAGSKMLDTLLHLHEGADYCYMSNVSFTSPAFLVGGSDQVDWQCISAN